jgi:uncharacterized protein YktA (UPF0223 family)
MLVSVMERFTSDKSGNTETHCQLFETGDVQPVDLVKYVDWPLDGNNNPFFPLVQLPPLQRGDVWKVAQVERLWDSVLRGFPIGSFLLTPFEAGKPSRSIDSPKQKLADRNGWFLLDGQQRTRALILGFHPKKQTARLWIDMAPQTGSMLDRAFLLRLCTEQHPWGMQQNDPDRKIEDDALREARKQLQEVLPEKAEEVKLHNDYGLLPEYTWPVRSTVPFADLVERVFQYGNDAKWDDLLPKRKLDNLGKYQKSSEQRILSAISNMLKRKVVLLELDPAADPMPDLQDSEHFDTPDAMETLFERVNSGGTRLEGEEMMFSLLKAKWSDAYTLVQTIVDHNKAGFLLPPTGIVLSATRLARAQLTQSGNRGEDDDVAKPKVRQFRRWIAERAVVDGKNDGPFLVQMKRFLKKQEESDEPRFVRIVLNFLKVAGYREGGDIGLPRPLFLALDRYAIDVVLRWIDMRCESPNFSDALDDSRLPILRFLIHSLLAWIHPEKASRRAFKVLSHEEIDRFPDLKIYESLIKEEEGPAVALKIPYPRDMEKRVISPPDRGGFSSYQELFSEKPHGEFVRQFWTQRVMLLWFQRAHLERLFPGYDPLKMKSGSPFDYDHILPSSHLFRQGKNSTFEENIDAEESRRFLDHRCFYRDSIGNYRIWPGWANRSDQATAPDKKFGLIHPDDPVSALLSELGYKSWSEIRVASAIHNEHIELWKKASGEPLDWKNSERRKGFQYAVETRVVSLYKSLYIALQYSDWFPRDTSTEKV